MYLAGRRGCFRGKRSGCSDPCVYHRVGNGRSTHIDNRTGGGGLSIRMSFFPLDDWSVIVFDVAVARKGTGVVFICRTPVA